jgi:hypothetical protein
MRRARDARPTHTRRARDAHTPRPQVAIAARTRARHVGFGIPTDLFGPSVTACVQVIRALTNDDVAEDAFRWCGVRAAVLQAEGPGFNPRWRLFRRIRRWRLWAWAVTLIEQIPSASPALCHC